MYEVSLSLKPFIFQLYISFHRSLSAIIDHPSYGLDNGLDNDYSLIKLSTTVDWTSNPHIRPVCLPDAGTVYNTGDPLLVTGDKIQ